MRYIVNSCLEKFENLRGKGWDPHQPGNVGVFQNRAGSKQLRLQPQPTREYSRWESDILAAEEVVLEALCFDMAVEQPWVIFTRRIQGLDDLWLDEVSAESRPSENGSSKKARHLVQSNLNEVGWALINET